MDHARRAAIYAKMVIGRIPPLALGGGGGGQEGGGGEGGGRMVGVVGEGPALPLPVKVGDLVMVGVREKGDAKKKGWRRG